MTKKRSNTSNEQEIFPTEETLQLPAPQTEIPPAEPKPPTEEPEFIPFCGIKDVFDPSSTSECSTICRKDCPDAFADCLKHQETKPSITKKRTSSATKERKPSAGKSFFGHVRGTQAGLIDDCLMNAERPMALDEIADCAGTERMPRVLHHIKHVQNNRMSQYAPDGNIWFNKESGYIHFDGNKTAHPASEGILIGINEYLINNFYKKIAVRK